MKLIWRLFHLFDCPKEHIKSETRPWNPKFPNHITTKHFCAKCDKEWILGGKVEPIEPWPEPPFDKMAFIQDKLNEGFKAIKEIDDRISENGNALNYGTTHIRKVLGEIEEAIKL